MIKKELYAAPETEGLELRLEGVIATSIDNNGGENLPGWSDGGDLG